MLLGELDEQRLKGFHAEDELCVESLGCLVLLAAGGLLLGALLLALRRLLLLGLALALLLALLGVVVVIVVVFEFVLIFVVVVIIVIVVVVVFLVFVVILERINKGLEELSDLRLQQRAAVAGELLECVPGLVFGLLLGELLGDGCERLVEVDEELEDGRRAYAAIAGGRHEIRTHGNDGRESLDGRVQALRSAVSGRGRDRIRGGPFYLFDD